MLRLQILKEPLNRNEESTTANVILTVRGILVALTFVRRNLLHTLLPVTRETAISSRRTQARSECAFMRLRSFPLRRPIPVSCKHVMDVHIVHAFFSVRTGRSSIALWLDGLIPYLPDSRPTTEYLNPPQVLRIASCY